MALTVGARGDAAVRAIQDCINSIAAHPNGPRLTKGQCEMHCRMIESVHPLVYGDDWKNCRDRVIASMRADERDALSDPSVWHSDSDEGTDATAIFLAALLYVTAGQLFSIGIHAPAQDKAARMLKRVSNYIHLLPNGSSMTDLSSTRLCVYKSDEHRAGHVFSVAYAKSDTADAKRGLHPHVKVADEAMFVSSRFFFYSIPQSLP